MYIISGPLIQHTHTPTLQYHIHIASQSTCHMFFLSSFMFRSHFSSFFFVLAYLLLTSFLRHSLNDNACYKCNLHHITITPKLQLQQQQLQPTNPASATAARVLSVAESFSTLTLLLGACLRLAGLPNRCLNQNACSMSNLTLHHDKSSNHLVWLQLCREFFPYGRFETLAGFMECRRVSGARRLR